MNNKNKTGQTGEKVSTRYAWYALFVLFMINLFNYVDRLSIGPAMEVLKRHFHTSDTTMGLLMSAFMAVYAIVSVPTGFLSDKGKRTRFVALGAFVWSIFSTLTGFCRSFFTFFIARSFVGSGEGIYAPSGGPLVADYFPKKVRNTAISIFMASMIVGGALAYIVAGLILKKTERFDIPKVASIVAASGEQSVSGWKYNGVSETRDRLAKFDFTNAGGEKISMVIGKFDPKKRAAFKSKFFNVNYYTNEKPVEVSAATAGAAALIAALDKRISERETRGIEKMSAQLVSLPRHFVIPAAYKNSLVYDKDKKELSYIGVMTEKDRKVIENISDKDEYIKAVSTIYSNTAYHYMRNDNWKWIFLILGPPGLLFAFLAFRLKEPVKGGSEEFITEEEARVIDAKGKANMAVIFRSPSVLLLIVANILASYCVGALNTWLFPFVERYKGIPSADAAIQFGPYVVACAAIGVVLSGVLADKLQKKTVIGGLIIVCVGLACSIPCLYVFFYAKERMIILSSVCAAIFFLSWINGPYNALLISLIEPRLRAFVIGMEILLIHLLGDAISPLVVGYLSDMHTLRYALSMLPLFLVAGIAVFIVSAIYVPRDLKALEVRMKSIAAN
jgi:MFS family permease